MSRVLHGMPLNTLPDPGELQPGDQIVAYREDTGKAYRSNIAGLGASANSNVSDAFNVLTSYSEGDYCIYNDTLYRFTSAHLGDWDENDVVATNVGLELQDNDSEISDVSNYVNSSISSMNTSINQVQSNLDTQVENLQSSIDSIPLIQYGSTTITYSGNDSVTKTISFSTKYSSSPYVFTQMQVSSAVLGYTDIGIYVSSRSTSSFVLRATANGNYAATVTVYWVAIGAK